ncbi:MAG: glycosyltransferase family 2 protein [Actinomycetota bacterium]
MSDTEWPTVSVVMPVLDEEAQLADAVRSILGQEYPGRLDVCLALGPSRDSTDAVARRLVEEDARVKIVANPTGGRSSGLNAAIGATTGAVVVRVDAHSVLPSGYIRRAVETLKRTGAANVGGVQRAVGHTPFQRAVASALTSPFGMGGARYHIGGNEGPTDTVFLGVFDRASIEQVGLFDETVVGNEDYELNIRLRADGRVVWFDPMLEVEYTPRSSLRALARQFFNYGAWKREVVRRHPTSVQPRQVAPPIVLASLLASIVIAWWMPIAWAVPLAYVVGVVLVSITSGRTIVERSWLVAVFPTMHMAWASGFLVGERRRSRSSAPTRSR